MKRVHRHIAGQCKFKTIVRYSPDGKKVSSICEEISTAHIIKRSEQYLKIIQAQRLPTKEQRKLITTTLGNFDAFFNRGFIQYRKSVAEAGAYAALEWRGKDTFIEDVTGRKFIDCLGGYGIYNTGINHPKIVRAVKAQLGKMPLSSQELLDPLRGALAEMLGELAPGDIQESFFINNGTDAVEGAIKLARLYTGKTGIISTINGFHGKSMGSLSLMGKATYRKPFEPLLDHVHFVPFGDATALEIELEKLSRLGKEVGAFIVEPVQGEAGAIVPSPEYLPRVRKICNKFGILLILDEVQTGMGRTGRNFACEHWDVVPDILCVGKSLGGGVMPLSAFMSTKRIWKVLEENPFIHSTTFGGNPLACAAGIATINVLLKERLAERAAVQGTYFLHGLKDLQRKYPRLLLEVRGLGLLIGMDFVHDAAGYKVAAGLFRRGVLVAGTLLSSRTIRIEPALTIAKKQIDIVLQKLNETLREVSATL
ncbi:MAG TPA: putrescine aminotransferase [Candidatus Nanoarchaeia archaeon]|nr:putrescine aminotransferase [Candidatus Nanoarchaeia archaeon]